MYYTALGNKFIKVINALEQLGRQRLQTSGLAAMAAGHAERQKEVRLAAAAWPLGPVLWERSQRSQKEESLAAAAAAWPLGPVLWERSQRSQKEESLAAAAAWPLGPVLWERSQRRWARPAPMYRICLACTCVLRSCARGASFSTTHTHKPCRTASACLLPVTGALRILYEPALARGGEGCERVIFKR